MDKKIEITIKGTQKDKEITIASLISKANYSELQKAIGQLDNDNLKKLAQVTHGRIYNRF